MTSLKQFEGHYYTDSFKELICSLGGGGKEEEERHLTKRATTNMDYAALYTKPIRKKSSKTKH